MKNDLPNAAILTKVRDAHCLTESEFKTLTAALAEMEVRRNLDSLDFGWENMVKKHVTLRRSKSGREGLIMSSWGEVMGGLLIGTGLLAYGSYMLWQFSQKPRHGDSMAPVLFFLCITVVGAWIIFNCRKTSKVVSEYDKGRLEYLSKRKILTNQLPGESRFPVRYCPNCLSRIWRSNEHPSLPPR